MPRFLSLFFLLNVVVLLIAATSFSAETAKKKTDLEKDKKPNALNKIESTRGGRHFIDDKTPPPRSPEESLKAFEVAPDFEVQLVASEPLIFDPVAVAFDQNGQLFAVEYSDYPIGSPDGKPLSKVILLEDTDGDGRSDVRHVFADKLKFAHSLMPYKNGILVGTDSEIIYLKDTNGDHRADIRQVLYTGFIQAHAQMHIGSPRWGLDNWVSLNYGRGKISRPGVDKKAVTMPRRDFLFHPTTMEFKPAGGWGQFGNTVDRWGNRFFCTNRNPVKMSRLTWEQSRRNRFTVISTTEVDVAPFGGETKVYPLVEMKSNYLSHVGTHTSACGVTAYTGDKFGERHDENSVFVCEPVGNLITRTQIASEKNGSGLTGVRARLKVDFLASHDPWFRPGSLANGPDGALYVADMYRLWVEHPKFVPKEVADKMDFRAGENRGRIWRVQRKNAKPKSFSPPHTVADKVVLLNNSNGWQRFLGQRLLVEQQSVEAEEAVRKLLQQSPSEFARLHAMWTLHGLGKLTNDDIFKCLKDQSFSLRRDATKIIANRLSQSEGAKKSEIEDRDFTHALAQLASDSEPRVRFEVALAVGELPLGVTKEESHMVASILVKLLLSDGNDSWMVTAVISSSQEVSGMILKKLLDDEKFVSKGVAWKANIIRQLATVVGARGDEKELAELLTNLTAPQKPQWWQHVGLTGLAVGLPRHRGATGRKSLSQLIKNPPALLIQQAKKVERLIEQSSEIALDSTQSESARIAAIEMQGFLAYKNSKGLYEKLLMPNQPVAVQLAVLESMRNGRTEAAALLLERWLGFGPTVREPALAFFFRRSDTTHLFLDAIKEGTIEQNALSIDQRFRLLRHGNKEIKLRATALLGGAISANRKKVSQEYQKSLALKPSIESGAKVFEKTCSKCHKRNGKGFQVGPDISDVRNRSKEALLFDILDPNSKVEPRFTDYIVITHKGRTVNGLLVSETPEAVVIRQAGGKEEIVPRSKILKMQASGKSLMPEGVEKEVSIQQMADLLEFLKSGK